jgi:hypothetical protein
LGLIVSKLQVLDEIRNIAFVTHTRAPSPPAFNTHMMFAHATQTRQTHKQTANLFRLQLVDEHTISSPVGR